MTPSLEMEFLGLAIKSKEMTISLPEEKLQKVKFQYLHLYQSPQVLGDLTSTIQAALSARINSRFLQQQQIQSSLERKEVMSGKYNFEQQLETGVSMVDKKFGDFQWNFSSQTGSTNCAPNGYVIDRLGCSSPGNINRRKMVISRKKMTYQRIGTTSS